jgi:hypothetical protein
MKRLLTLLALAGLSAAAGACGDDSGDDDSDTPKNDASVRNDAGGKPAPRPQQITNLAAKCTQNSECTGPGAVECLTDLEFGTGEPTELPGGYCTAQCEYAEECGPNGGCPVAEILESASGLLAALPGAVDLIKGFLPQNCIEVCTVGDAGGQGTCSRSDHLCQSLTQGMGGGAGLDISMLPGIGNSPALKKSYCFPPIEDAEGDAGVRNDAGASAIKLTGLDAGI